MKTEILEIEGSLEEGSDKWEDEFPNPNGYGPKGI